MGWALRRGKNVLNGEQALAYTRLRAIDSDYSRAQRQQKVIISLLQKYKGESLPQMLKILDKCLGLVTTDISKARIVDHAMELFGMVAGARIESGRIPVDGTFSEGYIQASQTHKLWCQYEIDFAANREKLQKIFMP